MTDLSDFGVDTPTADTPTETPEENSGGRTYRNDRCPAISVGHRGRCKSPVSRMKSAGRFCGTHGRQHDPWTIDDDPEMLILLTGELDALSLDDPDPEDVDFDLGVIREAVAAVQEDADAE